MSYRREIPKMNKDNFKAWNEIMRFHLETIGDLGLNYLDTNYVSPTRTITVEEIIKKKNHNIMMIDIVSTLNYVEFDEVKDGGIAFEMWIKLKVIYGGDENARRAKVKSLRVHFDQMKMREDEKIAKYVKESKQV